VPLFNLKNNGIMTTYAKSKIIVNRIIEILKSSEVDIDTTVSIQDTDLMDVLSDTDITDFDFNKVGGLKKQLNYMGYKIVYKDTKILKVKEDTFDIDKVPLKYC
jgi:hypothetical protein